MKRVLMLSLAIVLVCAGTRPANSQEDKTPTEKVTYDQVRAVFRKHCVTCHNVDRARGDLNLSTFDGIKAGSASGPAAVTGKAEESLIYTLSAHLESPTMPPGGKKIPQRELDLIRQWIDGGMLDKVPAVAATTKPVASVTKTAPASPLKSADVATAIIPIPRKTAVAALAASPTESIVAVTGMNQVVLFRTDTKAPLKAFPFPDGQVTSLRFSRDGKVLVAGGGVGGLSGKVVGFEVSTGKQLFELGDEPDVVLAVDISPDNKLVALGGPSRSVKLIRAADGELVATHRKHTDWILSVAFSPDGLLLASADRFGAVQVWEAHSGKEFHTLRGHVGPVNAIAWGAESDLLLSAGQDGTLRQWDMHQGTQTAKWNGEVGGVLAAEFAANGSVICGGRDRKLAAWSKPETRVLQISMPDEVIKAAVSHDGTKIIAADAAGSISLFTLSDGSSAGQLALPLAPAVARVETTRLLPTKPPRERTPATSGAGETAAAAAAELTDVREAAALAEAAVQSAEESLKKLRETAARLKSVVAQKEAAAKQAEQRASTKRTK